MCWICAASSTVAALLFTTVTPGAGWRRTRYSHESYLEMMRRTGKEVPLLLQKVLGLRLECFRIDVLHAVDLGVAAHIVGNILWESVVDHKWGGAHPRRTPGATRGRLQEVGARPGRATPRAPAGPAH